MYSNIVTGPENDHIDIFGPWFSLPQKSTELKFYKELILG